MLKQGQIVCDVCQSPITRLTEAPPDGWPQMHNLCSKCFADARQKSLPR